jgi:hypothetical protein
MTLATECRNAPVSIAPMRRLKSYALHSDKY